MTIMQPQIGIQLGYLMPEKKYKEWEHIKDANNTAVMDDLLLNIQNYAIPYQAKFIDYSMFFNTINDINYTPYLIRDRYLPILYYLKGDKLSGIRVIDEAIERQLHPTKPEVPHLEGASVKVFAGPSCGRVDPTYLTFAERFKNLPEPTQYNLLT